MKNEIANINLVIDNITLGVIRESNTHGYGLFAKSKIAKGTILCVLDGQVIKWNHYDELVEQLVEKNEQIKDLIFMEWNAITEDTLLVRSFRTKYSYINHSRKPNIRIEYNPIRLVALDNIDDNVEMLIDYRNEPLRKEYLDGHGKTYL